MAWVIETPDVHPEGLKLPRTWTLDSPLINQIPGSKSKVQSSAPGEEAKSEIGNRKSEIEWLRLGYVVIGVMLIGRW
ncbi:MAG: hypothetical protein ACLQVI_21230, partial [Polyangiaceae bacterium]